MFKKILILLFLFNFKLFSNYKYIETLKDYKKIRNRDLNIIMYSSPYCGPCNQMKPIYKDLSLKYKNLKFYIVDIDKNDLNFLVKKHNIKGIPTILMFKDGKPLLSERGSMSKIDLDKSISKFLKLNK